MSLRMFVVNSSPAFVEQYWAPCISLKINTNNNIRNMFDPQYLVKKYWTGLMCLKSEGHFFGLIELENEKFKKMKI